jgi:hypothetical protein
VWIVLLGTLVAGYAVSFRVQRRIWRARQVSGTRPPAGYWWDGDRRDVARFVVVTLAGAALVVVATSRLPGHDRLVWAGAETAFVAVLLAVVVRVRRAHAGR